MYNLKIMLHYFAESASIYDGRNWIIILCNNIFKIYVKLIFIILKKFFKQILILNLAGKGVGIGLRIYGLKTDQRRLNS